MVLYHSTKAELQLSVAVSYLELCIFLGALKPITHLLKSTPKPHLNCSVPSVRNDGDNPQIKFTERSVENQPKKDPTEEVQINK